MLTYRRDNVTNAPGSRQENELLKINGFRYVPGAP
jgi:hypothetical protein